MKKGRDEREAAENARIAAAVAEADRKAEAAAQKLADMRRKMQLDCDKVYISGVGKPPILIPIKSILIHQILMPILFPINCYLTAPMHDDRLTALMCVVHIVLVQSCWAI